MKDYGLVSIITPSYNSSKFIDNMVQSILSQTYTHWELLITDDASTDDTLSVISEYARKDSRIKIFSLKENCGAGVARNNSIKEANGRFIAFCDSDDTWLPHKLERQLSFMVENHYELTYTSYRIINESGIIEGNVNCLKHLSYWTLLRDNGIGCLTGMYDAQRFGKIYMPNIRKRQDWALWLSVIKQTKRAYGLQEVLATYQKRSTSISSNKIKLLRYNYKVYRDMEKFNGMVSWLLLMFYFIPYYFYKKFMYRYSCLRH